jgi:hypothetical protein
MTLGTQSTPLPQPVWKIYSLGPATSVLKLTSPIRQLWAELIKFGSPAAPFLCLTGRGVTDAQYILTSFGIWSAARRKLSDSRLSISHSRLQRRHDSRRVKSGQPLPGSVAVHNIPSFAGLTTAVEAGAPSQDLDLTDLPCMLYR